VHASWRNFPFATVCARGPVYSFPTFVGPVFSTGTVRGSSYVFSKQFLSVQLKIKNTINLAQITSSLE